MSPGIEAPSSHLEDPNYRALFAELRIYLSDQIEKMVEKSDTKTEFLIESNIKPLIEEAVRQSAELAAEKAIRKYCIRINVDFDNIEHMKAHALDMEFLRSKRKREENIVTTIISTLAKIITIGAVATILAKYFPFLDK